MADWIEKTLGEVTSFIAKGIPPKYSEEASKDTIRVLNQKCNRNFEISYSESRIHDCAQKKVPTDKMLKVGDVLINSTGNGTAGRVAQMMEVTAPTTIDGHMILLRPSEELDPIYYGYALKSHQSQIEGLAEGSTGQTEINRRRLQDEVIICYPSDKSIQKNIGNFLANIDGKIKTNTAINENLTDQAQAIYQQHFVTKANPDWPLGHLSDLINVKYGKDHKKLADGAYPVYGSGGIMRYVEHPLYEKESVLIPRKGTLNNVMYVNQPFWSVDTMFYTEMKQANVAKFVYHYVKSKDLASMNAGSAVPSMTTAILNAMELRIPSEEALFQFENSVAPMYEMIKKNEDQSRKLAQLRDVLLSKLMSGEIDVSNLVL